MMFNNLSQSTRNYRKVSQRLAWVFVLSMIVANKVRADDDIIILDPNSNLNPIIQFLINLQSFLVSLIW